MNVENIMSVFQNGENPYRDVLAAFLRMPVTHTDDVFAPFAQLPGAIDRKGAGAFRRFVYVPGSRKDRVLLVAHADTVWDRRYGIELEECKETQYGMGIYYSVSREHGIGADDRAGCAILWALRDSGHSLLILDGEEHGKIGARYLRDHEKKLFREINRTHRMMIALDAPGNQTYSVNQVDYTTAFRQYIEEHLEVGRSREPIGSDLQVLCQRICGVNLGIGYVNQHYPQEVLFENGWSNLCLKLENFLKQEHPAFPIDRKKRLKRKLKKHMTLPGRIWRKLKDTGFKGAAAAVARRIKK